MDDVVYYVRWSVVGRNRPGLFNADLDNYGNTPLQSENGMVHEMYAC